MTRDRELLDELIEEAPQGAANALVIIGYLIAATFALLIVAAIIALFFVFYYST